MAGRGGSSRSGADGAESGGPSRGGADGAESGRPTPYGYEARLRAEVPESWS